MKFSDLNKKGEMPPSPKPPEEPKAAAPPPKLPEKLKSPSKKFSFSQLNARLETASEEFPTPTSEETPDSLVSNSNEGEKTRISFRDIIASGKRQSDPIGSNTTPKAGPPLPMRTKALLPNQLSEMTAGVLQIQRQEAQKIYARAIHAMQAIISSIENHQLLINALLHEIVSDMLHLIQSENHALLALTTRSTANNYLYAHTVNTAVLALHIGHSLKWEEEQLFLLGATALLHDIGMSQYLGLAQERRTLDDAETQEVRLHPMKSEALLTHIKDIEVTTKQTIAKISSQVHERISGTGYPKGLKGAADIHVAAQVIGLCDTYEALSHYRAWRKPLLPHDAMKQIIRQCTRDFTPKLIKAFMEQLSVFPPGSYVQLSGGEIGAVVKINSHLLTRPVIEIKVQTDGNRQDPPILLDLMENPMVHASRAVDETKLNLKDKKLLLQFQAGRWWTE